MRVRNLMRPVPLYAAPWESLAVAGRTMTDAGVGVLPVIDADRRVVAVLTDRDVCCALTRHERLAREIRVAEVASAPPITCRADDEISTALDVMRAFSVRRLPVVDEHGLLEGILSLDEVVLAAHLLSRDELGGPVYADVVETLQAIVRPAALAVEAVHASAG
jgi:CBS domain-containing protein